MLKTFKDNSGNALLSAELPEEYETAAALDQADFQRARRLKLRAEAQKQGCMIGYQTGEAYQQIKYALYLMQQTPVGQRDASGIISGIFRNVFMDIDSIAASVTGKQIRPIERYYLPDHFMEKVREYAEKDAENGKQELYMMARGSSLPFTFLIRNYLLDGGMGVYKDGSKTIAVAIFRNGMETDILQGQSGVQEMITGEPFGQAQNIYNASQSVISWAVPYIMYMVSDNENDLEDFQHFVETVDMTPELKRYVEQFRVQETERQYQMMQMENAQAEATIQAMWQQHNQAWAANDRLRESLSRDMDAFRANMRQQTAASDARFNLGGSSAESLDDRIQRMRHESMMGVETYERSDGTTVEFSNQAERVFENNLDNLSHFGTQNYHDDYVPDGWKELFRKK